jgi:hypothetical protein
MKKENNKVGFYIAEIKTEQFAIFEENYSSKKETSLGTELQFQLDQTSNLIGISLGIEFIQLKKVFIKLQINCHFKIEESAWKSFIKNTKIVFPKLFITHLAMITTGTSRGILFAKTESTQFSRFIIPTLNVAEMITTDIEFDL